MAGCGERRVAWHPQGLPRWHFQMQASAQPLPRIPPAVHTYCADPPYFTSKFCFLTLLPKKELPLPLPQGSKAKQQSPRQPRVKRPTNRALTSRPGPWASRGLPSHSNTHNGYRPGEFGPWCTGSSRPAGGFLCGAGKGPWPQGVL